MSTIARKKKKAPSKKSAVVEQFGDSEYAVEEMRIVEITPGLEEVLLAEQPTSEELSSPEAAPHKPRSSPYIKAPVQLLIGPDETVHYVPRHLLPPDWSETGEEERFSLSRVSNETGHTLVHYLYTRSYETLATGASACVGFEQALLVYIMTAKYRLPLELEELAIHEMENHGSHLNLFETLAATETPFSELNDQSWIHGYLLKKAREAFESDHAIFKTEAFKESIGGAELHKFMMTCAIDLYDDRLSRMIDTEKDLKQELVRHNGLVQSESIEGDGLENVKDQEQSTSAYHDNLSSDDFCTISCPSSGRPVDDTLEETVCVEQDSVPDLSIPQVPVDAAIKVSTQDIVSDVPELGAEGSAVSAVMLVPEPEPVVDPFAGLSKSQRFKLQKKLKREAIAKAAEDKRLQTEATLAEQSFAPEVSAPDIPILGVVSGPECVPDDDPFVGFTMSQREKQTEMIAEAVAKAVERERLRFEAEKAELKALEEAEAEAKRIRSEEFELQRLVARLRQTAW